MAADRTLPDGLGIAGFIDRTDGTPLLCYTLPADKRLEQRFAQYMDEAKELFLAMIARERAL